MRVGGILWPYFSIRVVTLQLSIIQVEVEEKSDASIHKRARRINDGVRARRTVMEREQGEQ